ncbi:MAG TPA: stage II sporulation protein M [Tepidisphaeraceae bacterium]
MDLNSFLRQRRPRWQRLSELLDRVDNKGLQDLRPGEADELFSLYRLTSSDLNLVQTKTASAGVVDYLEGLVARAYAQLAGSNRAGFFRSWWMILRHYFPAAIRTEWRVVLLSTITMVAGVVCGMAATWGNPNNAEIFLPPEHLAQTPRERVTALEQMEREGHTRIGSADENVAFAVYLFNNNIRVGVMAFALGLTFGVGTIVVLFFNGAMLGSLMVLYLADSEAKFFFAWIGPHGSLELPCTIIAGAAGLMLAVQQLKQGDQPLLAKFRAIRPRLVDILVGESTLLVIAGCIEGGFSQINEPTINYWIKIAVAVVLFTALIIYLFVMPVKARADDDVS